MSYSNRVAGALLTTLITTSAQAAVWSPHIGADYKFWNMKPSQDVSNFYKQTFPRVGNAFNVYAGTRIENYFGLDVGFESSPVHRKFHVYEGGEIIFAEPFFAGDATEIDMQLTALHFDMNFYWEAFERFELIFMMGAAYLHPRTHVQVYDALTLSWFELENTSRPKWSGRFGFGAQYNFVPCFGMKMLINWDQTRRIEYQGFDPENNFYSIFPYHRSTTFNIGLVYSFAPVRH